MHFQKAAGAVVFFCSPLPVSFLKYINTPSLKEIAIEISQKTYEEWKFYVQGKTSSQDLMDFCSFREVLRLAPYRDRWNAADFLLHDTPGYEYHMWTF